MHERGAARAALAAALSAAGAGERVVRVELSVGELDGHGPDALALHFDDLSRGTRAQGAALEVRRRRALLRCRTCGLSPSLPGPCRACGGPVSVEGARGVQVDAVELRHPETGRCRRVALARPCGSMGSRSTPAWPPSG